MKITYLGQAGLLFETENKKIIIDPYLSDSVEKVNPLNYRRVAVEDRFLKIKPDILVFTHNHLDHYDPDTVKHYLDKESNVLVLSPSSVWKEVRKFGGNNNYVLFNRHTVWTESNIKFTAVKAEHSDSFSIGVIIDDGNKKYYITGDTLFNTEIFEDIPSDIYAVFLPVNGVGNNMNMADAALFAEKINAEYIVPLHIGMFDSISADDFQCKNKIEPKIYKEIRL
ncbi:MAG: MBL fold metallo-hydrolase [Clostridia bacterium]|nr:MBL fold metallo-hydrolase [Clostridia bacterium]